jgi:hypothetical protein
LPSKGGGKMTMNDELVEPMKMKKKTKNSNRTGEEHIKQMTVEEQTDITFKS